MRGFFAIEQPRGWKFVTAGSCSDFSFFLCDPDRPLRQILYFGQAGPVYTNACQREIDRTCSARGGYPTPWLDMPAVDLLTPETFLVQLPLVLASEIGGAFMPGGPRFEQIRIVAAQAVESPISGQCARARAAFLQNGTSARGCLASPSCRCFRSAGLRARDRSRVSALRSAAPKVESPGSSTSSPNARKDQESMTRTRATAPPDRISPTKESSGRAGRWRDARHHPGGLAKRMQVRDEESRDRYRLQNLQPLPGDTYNL